MKDGSGDAEGRGGESQGPWGRDFSRSFDRRGGSRLISRINTGFSGIARASDPVGRLGQLPPLWSPRGLRRGMG